MTELNKQVVRSTLSLKTMSSTLIANTINNEVGGYADVISVLNVVKQASAKAISIAPVVETEELLLAA